MGEPSESSFERLPLPSKLRIDAVCARFEAAWRKGRPDLAAFCAEVPTEERPALLAELLHIEAELRQRAGERPAAEDYLTRFPGHETIIQDVLGFATRPSQVPAAS